MTPIKETAIPLNVQYKDKSRRKAAHLAGSLAENLRDGEYLIKYRAVPTIFIRHNDWSSDLQVKEFNPKESPVLTLSDSTIFTLQESEIENNFGEAMYCRVVILSDKGFSSFKIDLNE